MSTPVFNAEQCATELYNAMKGVGTDNKTIIRIVANTTYLQREEIKKEYMRLYKTDLVEAIKSELSGNYEDAVIATFENPIDYDVIEIYKANDKKDEDSLIEIIATRPGWILQKINQKYKEKNGQTIEENFNKKLNGDLKKILTNLLQCKRKDDNGDPILEYCEEKAKELISCDDWTNDKSAFNTIMYECSPKELVMVCKYVNKLTGKTIKEVLEERKELSKEAKKYLKRILFAVMSPSEYFASRVDQAVKGWGTNDKLLIRILVTRDELDMDFIRKYYEKKYEKTMIQAIKDDCSGNYEDFLVELAGH